MSSLGTYLALFLVVVVTPFPFGFAPALPRQAEELEAIHSQKTEPHLESNIFSPYFSWKEKDWIDFRNVLKVLGTFVLRKNIHKPSANTKHNRSRTEKFSWYKIDLHCPMYYWSPKAARQLAQEAHAAPNSWCPELEENGLENDGCETNLDQTSLEPSREHRWVPRSLEAGDCRDPGRWPGIA